MPDLDIFAILLGRGAGPIRSRDVLAELAGVIPAFAAATAGQLPEFGLPIAGAEKDGKGGVPFNDAWTLHRGAQIYEAAGAGRNGPESLSSDLLAGPWQG